MRVKVDLREIYYFQLLESRGTKQLSRDYEISSYSVVLLGRFNPSIFTPSWLEKYELLTEKEAQSAEIKVIHPEISNFVADWLTLQVDSDRFIATCTISPVQLRDFVVKLFRDYLTHTPVHSLGINKEVHYKFRKTETRLKMGRALAPLQPWGDWGKEIDKADPSLPGGMMNLTMREIKSSREIPGHIQVVIQPSSRISGLNGVFLQINDHHELPDMRDIQGSDVMIGVLEENFDKSLERTDWILEQVLGPWEKQE